MRSQVRGFYGHLQRGTLVKRLRHGISLGHCIEEQPNVETQGRSATRLNKIARSMERRDSYLEIGLARGATFQDVAIVEKWGVDPEPQFRLDSLQQGMRVFATTSDDFFQSLDPEKKFDLIFLDGLHEWQQTFADLMHSLVHLAPGGVILIDDVFPDCEVSAIPDQAVSLSLRRASGDISTAWHGDVFKLVPVIREFVPNLNCLLVGNNSQDDNVQAIVWPHRHLTNFNESPPIEALAEFGSQIAFRDIEAGGRFSDHFVVCTESEAIDSATTF